MGRDRRIIDSNEEEALVDATLHALKVQSYVASTNDLDDIDTVLDSLAACLASVDTDKLIVQREDASGNVAPSMDAAARAGFQKITDGSDIMDLLSATESPSGVKGPLIFAVRREGVDNAHPLPVALNSDAVANKGVFVVPITPMTGGLEEGTFTRGFIPEHEVSEHDSAVTVTTATMTTVGSYTVTAGRTAHITDIFVTYHGADAGFEFIWQLTINGNTKIRGRCPAGESIQIAFTTPFDCSAGNDIDIDVRHWEGADKTFSASIHGFETVDSELD